MNKNSPRFGLEKRLLIMAMVVLLCAMFLMRQVASKVKEAQEDEFYKFADLFSEIYQEIQSKYVEDVDTQKLFEAAIQGMVSSLDDHSQYLDADALKELEKDTEGEFSGIGIHITLDKNKVLTVVAPIPGTPAAKLGIQPWDRIIEIEGKSTEGITLLEAVKKLTGPPGTQVTITVYRKGEAEPLQFTITRKVIKIKSVYYKMIDQEIGYIRLAKFSEETSHDLRSAIKDLKEKNNIKALVFDLRYNSGGLLKEAVEVGEVFVPKGKLIVSTKGRSESQNNEYYAEKEPLIRVPLAVLVNHATASASEIVAGAIKDHRLGVIIAPKGKKHTFGKGSVQTIEQLRHSLEVDENGNLRPEGIRITTAKYYTPSGESIQDNGIKADVEVELPKGHEVELIKQGLYGEPSIVEPQKELPAPEVEEETKTEPIELAPPPELKQELPEDELHIEEQPEEMPPGTKIEKEELPKEENEKFYLEKQEKEEKEEFVDIQLEYAVDLLKALLVIQERA